MHFSHTNSENELNNAKKGKQFSKGCFPILKDNAYILGGILIIVSMCMYGFMGIFGFSAYPDEFGYWTPAAALNGYDWSEITSLGSFYSYGYSLVLAPILFVFQNSVIAYRAAVVFNLFLQSLAVLVLYKILIQLFPDKNRKFLSIASVFSVMYPAWTFYTQTTMVEGLLNFIFILTLFLALKFYKKPGIVTGVLFAISLVYSYFVHMRCIGFIGAGLITLFIWALCQKNGKYAGKIWLIIILILALFGISFILKSGIISKIYSNTSEEVLSWNDYSGISYRLSRLLGTSGIITFIKDLSGKVLYLGLATYGIALWGIVSCARHFAFSIIEIKRKKTNYLTFGWIFVFLSVLAQFMVAMIYLIGASNTDNARLDIFLHGRYIDFFIPILLALGLVELLTIHRTGKLILIEALLILILAGCGFEAYRIICANDTLMSNAHGFTMIAMSYYMETPLKDTISFFVKEISILSAVSLIAFILILLYRKYKRETILLILVVVQIFFGMNTVEHYIFPNQSYIYGDIMLGEKLKEIRADYPLKQVTHIYEESRVTYIDLVQFTDRDAKIHIVNANYEQVDINQCMNDETILIIDIDSDFVQAADAFYENKWEIGHLNVYYTP